MRRNFPFTSEHKSDPIITLAKSFYETSIMDKVKSKSPFLVEKKNNVRYFPSTLVKKNIRPKRQPKGTVKVYALFSANVYNESGNSDELIDLTFSKEEAKDWVKQDGDHFYNTFYVKENIVCGKNKNTRRS